MSPYLKDKIIFLLINKNLPLCILFFTCRFILFFSSSRWFSIWVSIELNTIIFICFLFNNNKQKIERVLNYFIVQRVSSLFLLYRFIRGELWAMNITRPRLLIIITLCLKVGGAPFHRWFIPIALAISDKILLWIVLTIQKIIPLILLTLNRRKINWILIIFVTLCVILGRSLNIAQASIKIIIILSRLSNMGWLLIRSLKKINMENYLLIYTVIVAILIGFMPRTIKTQITKKQTTTIMLSMAILGRVPPLIGFLPKLIISITLIEKEIFTLLAIILRISTLDIFVYSRIRFLSAIRAKTSLFWESFKKSKVWIFFLANTIPLTSYL